MRDASRLMHVASLDRLYGPSTQCLQGVISLGVMKPEREADHSSVLTRGATLSPLPIRLHGVCLIEHRGNYPLVYFNQFVESVILQMKQWPQ
jgi:hypothetical protein